MIATKHAPLINYVAMLRSNLTDGELIHSLEKDLTTVGAGDFTGGWLIARPDALDVIEHLKLKLLLTCASRRRGITDPKIMCRRY